MKKLTLVFSLFAFGAFAAEFKGTIVDAKCGAGHADASEKSQACVKACVKKGAAPVLVSDGKIYKFKDTAKIDAHLGHKVTVSGTADGDTITVADVKMD